ncbi:hypothetical protein [Dictyobacter arantiisoli]|uniref:Uncharacterized protein n=1 Tax=Dictyobacter arantiisoli TaxID=2014874 RepID=A0A5A5TF42_9CHLR|nr:hypothetical protein [Dictyobacter arantiisoli]GCF09524.1 hypothetical protein KDI_30880 [Dictyobacter arantiisoli]
MPRKIADGGDSAVIEPMVSPPDGLAMGMYQADRQLRGDEGEKGRGWDENGKGGERRTLLKDLLTGRESKMTTYSGDRDTRDANRGVPELRLYDQKEFTVHHTFENGSTRPQLIELKNHEGESLKVLKFGNNERQIQTEVLANNLYRELGVPVLKSRLIYVRENEGSEAKLAQLTDLITKPEGATLVPMSSELHNSPDFYRHVAADMIFANWDLFKTDNWMAVDKRMVRADLGGALDIRAQGGMKEKFDGRQVEEITSMRAKDGPYHGLTDHEVADSIRTFCINLTPDKITRAMDKAHYPEKLQAEMVETLNARMDRALEWAHQHYPVKEVILVDYQSPATEIRRNSDSGSGSDSEKSNPDSEKSNTARLGRSGHDELATMKKLFTSEIFRNPGDPIRIPGESSSDGDDSSSRNGSEIGRNSDRSDDEQSRPSSRNAGFGYSDKWKDLFARNFFGTYSPLDARQRQEANADNPLWMPPLVGPEEILNHRQFDPGMRTALRRSVQRMKTGVLVRRMSDAEKEAFTSAAKSQDINKIVKFLFADSPRGEGIPNGRGEMVFSVNEPYKFERESQVEQKIAKNETLTRQERQQLENDKKNYKWIMEIPINDDMLDFFAQRAYISRPKEGSKLEAFASNPDAKFEMQADAKKNSDGIANVVLKPQGFAYLWKNVDVLRFFESDQHVWNHRSLDAEALQKARIELMKREGEAIASARKAAAENARARKAAATESDDVLLEGFFE